MQYAKCMVLIAGILLYIFLLKRLDSPTMSPVKTALFFILGYFALQSVIMVLLYYVQGVPLLPNLLNPPTIGTVLLQFVAAVLIFHKVDENSDEYMSYALWGGIGLATIFFIVPLLVQIVIMTL